MAADRLAKCVSRNGCGDRHCDNLPCSRSEAAWLSESCGDRNTIQHPVYGGHPCLEHLGECAGRLANVVSRHGTASTPLMPPEHSSRKKENLLGLKGPDQELRPEVCREQAGCPAIRAMLRKPKRLSQSTLLEVQRTCRHQPNWSILDPRET